MSTLLVHDGSVMCQILANDLDLVALDGRVATDDVLHAQCQASDRVVYSSSGWDAATAQREVRQVGVLIAALMGSGKRLVYVSDATVIGDTGDSFGNEDSARSSHPPHRWRAEGEQRLERAIADGVHSVIVRLALVHGRNAGALLDRLAAHASSTGLSVYIGDGSARLSTVHVDDVVSLIRLATDHAPRGARLVGASDEVVAWRELAVLLAASRGATPTSVSVDTATHAGLDGATMAISNVVRDQSAARRLGWQPTGSRLVAAVTPTSIS